jgi:hypothetical protein
VWCTTCGNNLHSKCFQVWANQKKAAHSSVTCVYCRAEWPDQGERGGQAERGGAFLHANRLHQHQRVELLCVSVPVLHFPNLLCFQDSKVVAAHSCA